MKTLPSKFWIIIRSKEHYELVKNKLISLGLNESGDKDKAVDGYENLIKRWPVDPCVSNSIYNKTHIGCQDAEFYRRASNLYGDQISTDQLLQFEAAKEISVILNNQYTAILSSSGIKVGCQTFPLEIIDKLVDARKQLN